MRMSAPIGFIGIGIMGKGMLKNLCSKLDSSFIVWNRSPAVCQEMATLFPKQIKIASTPSEVVQSCDVTYTMLSTIEASAAVFDAADGVIAGVSPGKLIVDCATLSPERMIVQEAAVKAKGGRFMEAPVSGSKGPADTGTLIFLCGGDAADFHSQEACFDAMGKAKYHFGDVGKGTNVKLVVNMVMGTMMGAFAEGLSLAQAADIPTDTLLQVLDQGAMSNPMFRMKGANMALDSHPTNFPLKHAQKDMGLALDLATQLGVTLPTTTAANAVMLQAMAPLPQGHDAGDLDFSAVIKATTKK